MKPNKEVNYSVCAFIDLLGFSAHLEVGADLRTTIGQEALQRLANLETVIKMIEHEKTNNPSHYPKIFDIRRINDALILTMDLPATLKPSIGDKAPFFYNKESNELLQTRLQDISDLEDRASQALKMHAQLTKESVTELMLFIGLVSRIHTFIFNLESDRHFPGPKTVVSTGYRASFVFDGKEDFLSANFALSNATKAESKLKGSGLFVDDTIIRLLSVSQHSLTIIRYSLLIAKEIGFNATEEPLSDIQNDFNHILYFPIKWVEADPVQIELFRTEFFFRELNPYPLVLLQILNHLLPYLTGEKIPRTNPVFRQTFSLLKSRLTFEKIKDKPRMILLVYPSLDKDIGELLSDFVNSQSDEYYRVSQ